MAKHLLNYLTHCLNDSCLIVNLIVVIALLSQRFVFNCRTVSLINNTIINVKLKLSMWNVFVHTSRSLAGTCYTESVVLYASSNIFSGGLISIIAI